MGENESWSCSDSLHHIQCAWSLSWRFYFCFARKTSQPPKLAIAQPLVLGECCESIKFSVRHRAHHELTHRLIQIRPAGIWFPKNQTWIHTGMFPWVIHLNRSGICISQVTCSLQVPADQSHTICLLWTDCTSCIYLFFATADITILWVDYSNILVCFLPPLQATALVLKDLNYLTFRNKPWDLTPCMQDSWGACWLIKQPMLKFAYSESTLRKPMLNITWRSYAARVD